MSTNSANNQIFNFLNTDLLGMYHLGKFYVTIETHSEKSQFDSCDEANSFIKLQQTHYVVIFHEYIHYLHEVSTYSGMMALNFDIMRKAIFSKYIDPNPKSSKFLGISDKEDKHLYTHTLAFEKVMFGSTTRELDIEKILNVTNVNLENIVKLDIIKNNLDKPHEFNIPLITVNCFTNKLTAIELYFGRFFILEGLAYEMDRIVDQKIYNRSEIVDTLKNTEYTVLRQVTKFLSPDTTTYEMLTMASLAMSYSEVGKRYLELLIKFSGLVKEKDRNQALTIIKTETKEYLERIEKPLIQELEGSIQAFKGRRQLTKAYTHLITTAQKLHVLRMKDPSYEIDLVFNDNFRMLYSDVTPPDQLFKFRSSDKYMRDLFVTSLTDETSHALKALIAFSHYASSHLLFDTESVEMKKNCECPFFTVCNLPDRIKYQSFCENRPWRLYEIKSKIDSRHCWYGQGVLEFKGVNEIDEV